MHALISKLIKAKSEVINAPEFCVGDDCDLELFTGFTIGGPNKSLFINEDNFLRIFRID